ncbi:MAG: K(+)-transporting ATPase subunit C [Acidimicrobiia bacterium]
MRRQLLPALRMLGVMTLLTGLIYTAAVTLLAQGFLSYQADGSLLKHHGVVVGSELLGQTFQTAGYFHPRPSAVGYDPSLSGGSNLGPNNPDLMEAVAERADAYRQINGLDPGTSIPVDAVTTSASGLDPHISVANARLQAERVARERGLAVEEVLAAIDRQTSETSVSYLSDSTVNVLRLNLALDDR